MNEQTVRGRKQQAGAARQRRLSEALRANLNRRKAQQRSRSPTSTCETGDDVPVASPAERQTSHQS